MLTRLLQVKHRWDLPWWLSHYSGRAVEICVPWSQGMSSLTVTGGLFLTEQYTNFQDHPTESGL